MVKSPRKIRAASWFYISFSGATEFLGAAFVRARDKRAAIARAKALGITPAGVEDTLCLPIPPKDLHRVPVKIRDRLLTEAETRKVGGKAVGE